MHQGAFRESKYTTTTEQRNHRNQKDTTEALKRAVQGENCDELQTQTRYSRIGNPDTSLPIMDDDCTLRVHRIRDGRLGDPLTRI